MKTDTIGYQDGDAALEGYIAYDDTMDGARPGIVIYHDWMGVGPYVENRCRQLAQLGYVAFAADIYGRDSRPSGREDAPVIAGRFKNDRKLMRRRASAGLEALKHSGPADPGRLAAIGYCFGGTCALELARSGADIKGVITFHGGLDTPSPGDAANIKGKVLVLHGADDPFVPPSQVQAFQEEMRAAKVDWHMVSYGFAVHSFTIPNAGDDPSQGAAYNRTADRRSWQAMRTFLEEVLT
jgi:dienelactone hydrolase